MIYDVRQVTTYKYAATVPFSRHILRMAPVNRPGQRVILSTLSIDPKPVEYREELDFFGNRAALVAIDVPHEELVIELKARVEVAVSEPFLPGLTPPWEEVRDMVARSDDLSPLSPVHFIFPSRSVPLEAEIRDWAADCFPPGRPILAGASALMSRIHTEFTYEPGVTTATTPPIESFKHRRGVCQDFAHVMISGMRSLGLPIGYVSGYLRTLPPPGQPRLEGADATHAWVEVWCGPDVGWIGLDPTNDIPSGEDHILLAIGRDYADVSPMEGVYVSAGDDTLDVAVDVVPLGQGGEKAAAKAAPRGDEVGPIPLPTQVPGAGASPNKGG
ncbi:hypothetical protein HDIA_4299 [Hartmannibacter diazotrophicus]|uniref:Transglutaminase-like domain-containing protein n=1 Tax=Hartmannibacter diazotrophicus TaxID=1482074 RepID=A0A2C9DCD9_9HYPH|nr:transglutaminase family protein [Hartmannibacter diazotrophicus]SON57840.1 hypothetical protein HDIA_4299 [Hartmannibacter diazotrophicus]